MAGNEQKAEALVEQGLQLYSQGQLNEALDSWNEALGLVPDHARAQEYLKYVSENREALEERFQFAADGEAGAGGAAPEGGGAPYPEDSTSEIANEILQARIDESREARGMEKRGEAPEQRPPLSVMEGGGHDGGGFQPLEETPVGGLRPERMAADDPAQQEGATTRPHGTAGDSSDEVELTIQEVVAIATEGDSAPESSDSASLELHLDEGELDLDDIPPEAVGMAQEALGPTYKSEDFSLSQLGLEDDDGGGSIDLDSSQADELVLDQRDVDQEDGEEIPGRRARGTSDLPRRESDEVELDLSSSQMNSLAQQEGDDLVELMFEGDNPGESEEIPSRTAGTALPAGGGFQEEDETPSRKWTPEDVERMTFSTPELDDEDQNWEESGHVSTGHGDTGAKGAELVIRARDLADSGKYEESLDLCHKALDLNPENERAHDLLERLQKQLLKTYAEEIGELDSVPSVLVARQEIVWQKMDHRAGFLLSRIDGMLTYEDIIDVSGMNRFEVTRILVQLLREGIIGRG